MNKAGFFMDFPFASSGSWLFNRYNTGQPHLVAIISQSVPKDVVGLWAAIFPERVHLRSDSLNPLCFDKPQA